jgi:hypothetical protein
MTYEMANIRAFLIGTLATLTFVATACKQPPRDVASASVPNRSAENHDVTPAPGASSKERPSAPEAAHPRTAAEANGEPRRANGSDDSSLDSAVKVPCGPLDCLAFGSAESALAYITTKERPRVLAVGEIHAQKGHQLKKTPTAHFAALLPYFRMRAKHLVVELWTGRNDCGDDRVEQVRKAQEPVTAAHATSNKNEYFELGSSAKALGIAPHALVPSCQDYQAILNAKSDDLDRMLELTATKTAEVVESLLAKEPSTEHVPEILTYGGALHNDATPRPGREHWSFGPRVAKGTNGRYIELDWILREQVLDSPSFTAQPWYPHFRSETLEKHFSLYKVGPSSYALVFPAQRYLP